MSKDSDAGRHADAVAETLGLDIAAWRDGVVFHLAAIARAADTVAEFDLPPTAEPAWRFEA